MCVMSMDRFFTIKFPLKYGRNKTRKFMLGKIVTVWLISSLISSPMLVLGIRDPVNVYSNGTCSLNHSGFKLYGSVLAFYIPFAIITITYSFTMRALKKLMRSKEDDAKALSKVRNSVKSYKNTIGDSQEELFKPKYQDIGMNLKNQDFIL